MTSILKKVLSLRDVREATVAIKYEGDPTPMVMQEAETEETTPIPNFAEAGITDHTAILEELSWGPAASLYVGKEAKLFTLPKRLLIYHSAVARQRLAPKSDHQARPNTLIARDGDPRACFHIIQWMKRDTLPIVSHCTRTAISASDLQDACILLCRIFALANDLAIPAICAPIVTQLRATFTLARDLGMPTPVVPGAVMEVWNVGGENSVLWKLLVEELCGAFSSTPRPVYEDYEACIGVITPLRLALGDVMGRRIYDLLERRGVGEDLEVSWGQKGGEGLETGI